jgi:predicted nucleic acid-binding protein
VIVVDASVVLDVLLRTPDSDALLERMLGASPVVHAPHLLDLEVAQVTRRYWLAGEIGAGRGTEVIADLGALPIRRYPHEHMLERIWELRGNVTAYDAAYLALAEALDMPLLTRDRRLAAAPGHRARVEVV